MLIMEYAMYKTLDTYLRKNKTTLKLSHQLTAAVQLINALDYLVSKMIAGSEIGGELCESIQLLAK